MTTSPLSRRLPILALVAIGVPLVFGSAVGCSRAMAQTSAPSEERRPDGATAVELVVYSGDFGMVRETRPVELAQGQTRLGIQNVSKRLDQNSVLFDWPSTKDAEVVSSTYDLGVENSGRLLERFVGKKIELIYRGEDGRAGERIEGILQVAEPGNVVVLAGGKYIVNPNASIEAPADSGIVTIPQLSAEVRSKTAGTTPLAISYMTTGLSWNADYVATLAPDADRLDLQCWATVTNTTGAEYRDASIRFVAGSPNRAVREARSRFQDQARAGRVAPMSEAKELQMPTSPAPTAMGELYAYPYKSTATIRQDQSNRVRMMNSDAVTVKRVYSVAMPALYREWGTLDPNRRVTASMGINFVNAKDSGLGQPLPAGAVRVYEPDSTGAARYVGAANLSDTPKDARVSVELTDVFDVYARARQTAARRIDKRRSSRSVEVTLTNEKSKAVEVRVVQPFGGVWKMAYETIKSGRVSSGQNEWRVSVPAGGETKLRYTVVLTE